MRKKQHRCKTCLILLSMLFAFAQTVYAQDLQEYKVYKTNTKITIDGILDEQAWKSIEPTGNFVILGNNETPPKTDTRAKMLWDDNYLYVAFFCEDKNLVAAYKDRDDPLYKEDVVEVYIDPDGDGEKYLEVEVSPTNVIFDLWLSKPRKQGGSGYPDWTMAGLKTQSTYSGSLNTNSDQDDSWICEMALPFEAMKFSSNSVNFPPREKEIWRFNLYRFDRAYNNDKNGEATGWCQTDGGQHEPDKFGKLIFEGLSSGTTPARQIKKSNGANKLLQNYPNPCKQITDINFCLSGSQFVNITVYNSQGRRIEQLVNQSMNAGNHRILWNAGKNPTGLYYCKMYSKGFSATRKMVLIN